VNALVEADRTLVSHQVYIPSKIVFSGLIHFARNTLRKRREKKHTKARNYPHIYI